MNPIVPEPVAAKNNAVVRIFPTPAATQAACRDLPHSGSAFLWIPGRTKPEKREDQS
jgi:hypothetical protein